MTSSFEGHTEVVRELIGAEAQINAKEEVCHSYYQKCISYTAVVYVYIIYM